MLTKQNTQPTTKRRLRNRCTRLWRQVKTVYVRARRRAALRGLHEVTVWLPPYKVDELDLLRLFDDMWKLTLGGFRVTIKQYSPQKSGEHTGLFVWWYEGKLVFQKELNLPQKVGRGKPISFPLASFLFPPKFVLTY